MTGADVETWRDALKQHWLIGEEAREKLRARARAIVEAWDSRQTAIREINVAHGVVALDCKAGEIGDELYRVELEIFALPATTPEGWRLKARIVSATLVGQEDNTYEDAVIRNLLADLLRQA
jgi:hypothetical protein